jgi:myo-inositol-1(or 4)-monophosphatase
VIEARLLASTRAAIAALRAVRPLIEQRRGAREVAEKAPNDIVTQTDVMVQNHVEQVLREHEPEIAFRGEEGTRATGEMARRTWLVDPICGTGNYVAALPLFATNIALVEDGSIISAAVADGATGGIYVAERGRGAWRVASEGLDRLYVDGTYPTLSVDPEIWTRAGVEDFPTAFALEAIQARRWDVRILGSTVALLHVAIGTISAAVYAPRGEPLHVAAGALLAAEAGATVTDHTGAPWSIERPVLIASATPEMHTEIHALAARVYADLAG